MGTDFFRTLFPGSQIVHELRQHLIVSGLVMGGNGNADHFAVRFLHGHQNGGIKGDVTGIFLYGIIHPGDAAAYDPALFLCADLLKDCFVIKAPFGKDRAAPARKRGGSG